jgi:hypothetical protein
MYLYPLQQEKLLATCIHKGNKLAAPYLSFLDMFMMQIRGKISFNSSGNGYVRVLNSSFATVPVTYDAMVYSQVTFWV